MTAQEWIDLLFLETWWTYESSGRSFHAIVYHAFNLAEGAVWVLCGAYVLYRFARHRRSSLEVVYGAAFLLFAVSDFREAWSLDSWLIWLKALLLGTLLWLRSTVRRRYYPGAAML